VTAVLGVTKTLAGRLVKPATILNVGYAGYEAYQYKKEHAQGSWLEAGMVGAAKAAFFYYLPVLSIGYELAKAAPSLIGTIGALSRRNYNPAAPNFGGQLIDSAAKATMRQRGVQAIQQSRLHARSVLGNEARRISRAYFEH
jgi:hypothetical protein